MGLGWDWMGLDGMAGRVGLGWWDLLQIDCRQEDIINKVMLVGTLPIIPNDDIYNIVSKFTIIHDSTDNTKEQA